MGKKRVQLDLEEDQIAQLDKLKVRSRSTSRAEVVKNSLRLYEWFLAQKDDGWEIALVKDDEEKIVELVF